MADILDILKDVGIEIPEDKKDEFNTAFRKSYKSEGELRKIKEELKKANDKIVEMQGQVDEYNTLKTKYETETADYQKQLADIRFNSILDSELKGVEFANKRVKESILAEIRAKEFKEKDGKLEGLSEYLKGLYESEPEIFKNVDSEIHTWGKSNIEQDTGSSRSVFEDDVVFL